MLIAPRTHSMDNLIALFRFVLSHKRLPKKYDGLSLQDYLYQVKTSEELRSPICSFTTDKALVKDYIRLKVGDRYNVPTLGVFNSLDELLNSALTFPCVIKPTHLSGEVIFADSVFDLNEKTIAEWMNRNHYFSRREANYRYLLPRIIVEPVLFNNRNINDVKIFCKTGVPSFFQIDYDRTENHTRLLHAMNGESLNCSVGYPIYTGRQLTLESSTLEKMIEIAKALSADFSFVRIDMYFEGNKVYVGEITHVHGSANERFFPRCAEHRIADILQ